MSPANLVAVFQICPRVLFPVWNAFWKCCLYIYLSTTLQALERRLGNHWKPHLLLHFPPHTSPLPCRKFLSLDLRNVTLFVAWFLLAACGTSFTLRGSFLFRWGCFRPRARVRFSSIFYFLRTHIRCAMIITTCRNQNIPLPFCCSMYV